MKGGPKHFVTRRENSVLWIEIHNPPVNFLTVAMLEELLEVVRQAERDDSIRVVVLTGGLEGVYIMHFFIPELLVLAEGNRKILLDLLARFRLTGAILARAATMANTLMDWFPRCEDLWLRLARRLSGYSASLYTWFLMQRVYLAIERLGKVTIAAVNGTCNGGGTELSACFDFRFMVSDRGYTIGQPECLINIVPGGGSTQRLPRLIGKARSLELMLRGNQWSPQEARQAGLITECFPADQFRQRVQEFAELMSRRPMTAIDAIKKCVRQGMDSTLLHGLSIEMLQSVRCLDTEDTSGAMKAYIRYLDEHVTPLEHPGTEAGAVDRVAVETIRRLEAGEMYIFRH